MSSAWSVDAGGTLRARRRSALAAVACTQAQTLSQPSSSGMGKWQGCRDLRRRISRWWRRRWRLLPWGARERADESLRLIAHRVRPAALHRDLHTVLAVVAGMVQAAAADTIRVAVIARVPVATQRRVLATQPQQEATLASGYAHMLFPSESIPASHSPCAWLELSGWPGAQCRYADSCSGPA